jgi:lysophospholipase L1-like esterase
VVRASFLIAALIPGCTAPSPSSPAATASATASAPSPTARYLALGDSFTIGTGSGPELAFPARLVARSGCGVTLRNVAVNGYSTQEILDEELPALASFAPTFVTLAVGANDIVRRRGPDEYRANVRRIVQAVVAAGGPRLVAIPQPDWSLSPVAADFGDPAALRASIDRYNAILREETTAAGGTYVDLFPLMEQQAQARMIARDGLHPSAASHDAWAAELFARGAGPCGG